MSNPIEQRRKADAWVQGFLFSYFLNRGYSIAEATERARGDVPDHLVEDVPVWNPYDPQTALPEHDVFPFANTPDEEIEANAQRMREEHREIWQKWMDWIMPRRIFTLNCLDCGTPREIIPDGPLTQCPECGGGFVTGP